MEVETKILVHGLVKQTQFCVSFIALWSQNRRFKDRKLSVFKSVIVPMLMYDHESWVTTEKILSIEQWQWWDICEVFSVWHFVTKSTGLISLEPGTLSHFSESREPSYISSVMCPECPRKEWWNSLSPSDYSPHYTYGKAAQRSFKD